MKSLRSYTAIPTRLPIDLILTATAFLSSYWLAAVHDFPRKLAAGSPAIDGYVVLLVVTLFAFVVSAHTFRLYRARRAGSYLGLALDVFKVQFHLALIIFAILFYLRIFSFSRVILSSFFTLNTILIFGHHTLWMLRERFLFSRGVGLRSCVVVGVGKLAKNFAERVSNHPWTGLRIVGFIDPGADEREAVDAGAVLGSLDDLEQLVEEKKVQEVVVALPFRSLGLVGEVDSRLSRVTSGIRMILDLDAFNTLAREISEFDGMQVINLRGVRAYGMHAFCKRALDVVISALLIVMLSPVLIGISLYMLIFEGRPILFRQDRVGLDGMVFPMFKFRSMRCDAEDHTGPVFAETDDPRCTKFGLFLRRTSLDELPQLFNVLRGQMSLVGPRPERPFFINQFKNSVPKYMLRHHMKAGLTGWAQVHGWRGKTSLSKRIQYDLYYLKNWSIWLDVKILFMTLFRAWSHKDPEIVEPTGRQLPAE